MPLFNRLPEEAVSKIVSSVEFEDIPALATACHKLDRVCREIPGIDHSQYNQQTIFARRATITEANNGSTESHLASPSLTPEAALQPEVINNSNTMTLNQRVVHFSSADQLTTGSTSNSSSRSSSPAGHTFDTNTSSDTDLTTPEEDEWEFELTPDILHRLGKLPRRKSGASLPTLPTELQCEIFSYLDQIDATCLGLTSPRAYSIYRSIHGTKMPLNTRRQGPNPMERAWKLNGKACAHCGTYRCELYQHIKEWMPKDLEYCSFKNMFGTRAEEGMAENCFRGKPSKPRRCGRHPLRTTSVHQDDSLAMQAAR